MNQRTSVNMTVHKTRVKARVRKNTRRIAIPNDINRIEVEFLALDGNMLGPVDSTFDLCTYTAAPAPRVHGRADGTLEAYAGTQGLLDNWPDWTH